MVRWQRQVPMEDKFIAYISQFQTCCDQGTAFGSLMPGGTWVMPSALAGLQIKIFAENRLFSISEMNKFIPGLQGPKMSKHSKLQNIKTQLIYDVSNMARNKNANQID